MDQIRNYIDAMFSSLPKTREIIEIKLNMLENMEEKFQELLKKGKSEDEAVGIVLKDFGNIEELKEELGISDKVSQTKEPQAPIRENSNSNFKPTILSLIDDAIFPITAIIYLCMGFFANLWHPGWAIFIIAVTLRRIIRSFAFCKKNPH